MSNQAIGIVDSGVGGFTVAHAVQQLLPHENIIYHGDGANAPYGNRKQSELVALSKHMVAFTNQKQVKLLLVACNTISCIANLYENEIKCPVLYVVKSGATGASTLDHNTIGVISTKFTHESGVYRRYIHEKSPEKRVISNYSTDLVQLIEDRTDTPESAKALEKSVKTVMTPLVDQNITACILGCTHYPLVSDAIAQCYPEIELLDPAVLMAQQAKDLLEKAGQLNKSGDLGRIGIYTTGEINGQENHAKRAKLQRISGIYQNESLDLENAII